MSVFFDSLNTIFQINKKNLKFVILFLIICGIFFPIIDSLIIKPIQITQEISILKEINSLKLLNFDSDIEKALNEDLIKKTNVLLSANEISFDIYQIYKINPWKFYSAIILWLIVLIVFIFQRGLKWYQKLASLILLIIFIFVIGIIGLLLPIIISPWVNYIAYPIIQIIFIYSCLEIKPNNSKQ